MYTTYKNNNVYGVIAEKNEVSNVFQLIRGHSGPLWALDVWTIYIRIREE